MMTKLSLIICLSCLSKLTKSKGGGGPFAQAQPVDQNDQLQQNNLPLDVSAVQHA
jgi:hypothetical protein